MGWAVPVSFLGGGLAGLLFWVVAMKAHGRASASNLRRRLQNDGTPAGVNPPGIMLSSPEERYSHLPVLRLLIHRTSVSRPVLNLIEQAGSTLNVSSYLLIHACCLAAAWWAVTSLRVPALPSVVLLFLAAMLPVGVMLAKRKKRFSLLNEQLSDATLMIASALRSGLSLEISTGLVADEGTDPIRSEFRKLINEARLYSSMNVALQNLSRRVPTKDFLLFTSCARLHRDVGGNFAPLLDQLGRTIRERLQLYRELKTLTAESRFSGWVLGALPLLIGFCVFSLNPSYFFPLLHEKVGQQLLWTAAALQLIGLGIIRWLTSPRIH